MINDLPGGGSREWGQLVAPSLCVDDKDAIRVLGCDAERGPEIVAIDERKVGGRGDEELALGMGEISGELISSVSWVCPYDCGTDQGCCFEPQEVVHRVVEHDGDMEVTRIPTIVQPCAARCRLGDRLRVGPGALGGQNPRSIDVGQSKHEGRHRLILSHLYISRCSR